MTDLSGDSLRLDVWLWRARFFKTRRLAGEHIAGRGVRMTRLGRTRRIDKPGASVRAGDVLTFAKGSHIHAIEIVGLGTRRGPPDEARGLYRPVPEK